MTLPASFPITIDQIRAEYGLSFPVNLRSFIGQSGFPASGPISMSNFLGKTAPGSGLKFLTFPSDVSNARIGAGSLTSSASSGTATGGTPGYTYAWTYVSGDSFTINSPSSNSTTFTTTLIAGQTKTGVYRLTATDAVAATVFVSIIVELEAL